MIEEKVMKLPNLNITIKVLEKLVFLVSKKFKTFDVLNYNNTVKIVDNNIELRLDVKLNYKLKSIKSLFQLVENELCQTFFFFCSKKPIFIVLKVV